MPVQLALSYSPLDSQAPRPPAPGVPARSELVESLPPSAEAASPGRGRFPLLVACALDDVPVDLLADPDGSWDYEGFLATAREITGAPGEVASVQIGALTRPFLGFPEGAAVVFFASGGQPRVLLVDCSSSPAMRHAAA